MSMRTTSMSSPTPDTGEQACPGSSLLAAGTMIEWYDFYIFGSLATVIASKFYQTGTPIGDIIACSPPAIGFLVRPFGAIVFGRIGDLIGRKYTFLVTMTLMGLCTFAVGLLPTIEVLGAWAGIILISCASCNLALGGEYGGAASYVAEHAPNGRRGFFTSWIQITATLGLFMSLGVIPAHPECPGRGRICRMGLACPVPDLHRAGRLIAVHPLFAGVTHVRRLSKKAALPRTPLKESFGNSL